MSAYSAILNSEIAVGAPFTNTLATKYRDNMLAIQENDATAPDVQYAVTAGSISGQGALATLNQIGYSHLGSNIIRDSNIDWANAQGIGKSNLIVSGSTDQAVYTSLDTDYVFIPQGATYIEYLIKMQVSNGIQTGNARLIKGADLGDAASTSSTSLVWVGDGSNLRLNISAYSGWQEITLQANVTGGATVSITKGVYRFV